jgi:PAS domain S-box-containing protein
MAVYGKKNRMRLQIRQTHSVGLLAALTIAAIVLSVTFLVWQLKQRELAQAQTETATISNVVLEQMLQNFEGADNLLVGVQERLSNVYGSQFSLDSPQTHLLLSARASGMRQLSALFLVDAQGRVVNSSREFPVAMKSVADREYYKAISQDPTKTFFLDKPVRNRLDNSWTLHMARPLFDVNMRFRGVVVAAMSIAKFELMYTVVKLHYERQISLYMADGTLIASLPHRDDDIGKLAGELAGVNLTTPKSGVYPKIYSVKDGTKNTLSLHGLPKYAVMVGVTDDLYQSLATWRETIVPILIGAFMVIVFTASVSVFLIRKLIRKEELSQELRAANDLYQHTVNSVMDAIVAIDDSQKIVLFNPAAEHMFGLKECDVVGQSFNRLIPERARARHQGHVETFSNTPSISRTMAPQLEITGRRVDGTEFPIESTISKSMIGGKLQMTAVLRDVTEHRRVVVELREVNQQLRNLSTSLQSVREQERARLSRELHDELGQQLTGLKLSLSWLGNRLKDGRSATPDTVDEMRHLLDAAIASVRRISTELRPPILDDLGFGDAVSWMASEFYKRSGLTVVLDLQFAEQIKGEALTTALYRIVQESLTNVVRHAGATQVQIDLVASGKKMILTVRDNGKGMSDSAKLGGIGLVSMRERAHSIDAQFSISSVFGKGTTVEVNFPKTEINLSEEVA